MLGRSSAMTAVYASSRCTAAGADPDARQSGGWTPLHAAARNGDLASVAMLLEAGADPSATNDEGAAVLEMAHASGDAATVEAIAAALAP